MMQLGVVFDGRVRGRLERELVGLDCRVELHVRVDELDLAGSTFSIELREPMRLAVGTDRRVLEDRGNLADQDQPVRPAIVLAQVEGRQAGHVGRQRAGRGQGPLIGPDQSASIPPGAAEHPDGLAVEQRLLPCWSNLIDFRRPTSNASGPANPIWVMN